MTEWLTTGQMIDRLLDGEVALNEKGQQVRLDKFGKLIWINEPVQTPGVVMTSKVLMSRWTIQEGQAS